MNKNTVGLLIDPEVTRTEISSKETKLCVKFVTEFFLLAVNEIVCNATPFLKMVTVPVEFAEEHIETAIN